jgi:hypothetical protein
MKAATLDTVALPLTNDIKTQDYSLKFYDFFTDAMLFYA